MIVKRLHSTIHLDRDAMVGETTKAKKPVNVLLVEDDLGDAKITMEAFKAFRVPLKVSRVRDGEEAVDYLRQKGEFQEASRPDLIFLDLKMPKKNGFEVLADIKNDSHLEAIPVMVLTSSCAPEDIQAAYEAKANFYITKPTKVDEFFAAMKHVEEFWIEKMVFPSE